jgi:hypothetical protein
MPKRRFLDPEGAGNAECHAHSQPHLQKKKHMR